MSSRIRVLADDVANKIAAGEVVERPASIVKELVENALDAGADRVDISVDSGGSTSIRIVDNGCGMSRDDALLALERHATSKLRTAEDLTNLRTLGFRGEALPSIAAVSRLTLDTRIPEAEEGTRVVVEGGRVIDVRAVGRDAGTTLLVERLFQNTPARRKFLKSAETEWRHVVQTTAGLAFAHPQVMFSLDHEGRRHFRLGRSDVATRIQALFAVTLGEDAVFVEAQRSGLRCTGYVCLPDRARKAAQHVLVVNQRWVRHRGLTTAVHDGYGGLLQKGVQPAYALCLNIDPGAIDVNVHPSKREIRFADERAVYRFVAEAVRSALRRETSIPEWADETIESVELKSGVPAGTSDNGPQPTIVADRPTEDLYLAEPLDLHNVQMGLPLTITKGMETSTDAPPEAETRYGVSVFQLHSAYVLAQVRDGAVIIDQNLAHRRILYEEAIVRFRGQAGSGQALLFPVTLEFGLTEIVAVRDALPLFERVGFGIRDFGGNSVVVDAIPVGLDGWEEGVMFRDMVDDLLAEGTSTMALGDRGVEPIEHLVALTYARHAAIPHGKILSGDEMRALIDALFATDEPYASPEGRPTLFRFSLQDIERRFE